MMYEFACRWIIVALIGAAITHIFGERKDAAFRAKLWVLFPWVVCVGVIIFHRHLKKFLQYCFYELFNIKFPEKKI